jgi:hypothetical protein
MVMELCQHAVTPFDSRGGPLKGVDLLRRPRVPLLHSLRRPPQGEFMRVKRGPHRLACLPYLGFSVRASCVGSMVFPIDPWQQALLGPVSPRCGEGGVLQVALDALPPTLDESRQGRHLLADLLHGAGTGWPLLANIKRRSPIYRQV